MTDVVRSRRARVSGPAWAAFGALAIGVGVGGCAEQAPVPDGQTPLLAPEVEVEIGSMDGDEEFVFASLESVRPTAGGGVIVSDGGATRISMYDTDGSFVRSFGSEGEGPGEFRNLARLHAYPGDSVLASERFEDRLTVFTSTGEIGRTMPASELSGDEVFKLDSWFHGRYWIEGALTEADRAPVRQLLDRLPPPPPTWPGYRRVAAADGGSVWIAEPSVPTGTRWTRVGADGAATAAVDLPRALRPTYWSEDRVWGVWTGEADVHFARVYTFRRTDEQASTPTWMIEPAATPEGSAEAPSDDEVLDRIRPVIRAMASQQEIHYSSAMSYTSDISELEDLHLPDGLHVDVPVAGPRGWVGIFVYRDAGRACALGYGFTMPPGWPPGQMACAPTGQGG